jgi:hypothetical protein
LHDEYLFFFDVDVLHLRTFLNVRGNVAFDTDKSPTQSAGRFKCAKAYSIANDDWPMIVRSITEIALLVVSSLYIVRNKLVLGQSPQVLPT